MLKLYAWEPSFEDQIQEIRNGEVAALKGAAYLNAFAYFIWTCAPFLVALSAFAVFVLSDPNNVLDAQTAFVSLTYFNLLKAPLYYLPSLIVYMVQCAVSLKRINLFMNSEELSPDTLSNDETVREPILAQKASFTWDNTRNHLQDIDLNVSKSQGIIDYNNSQVNPGSLVAVVGAVGSGKSSLLSAFLGELTRTSGRVNVHTRLLRCESIFPFNCSLPQCCVRASTGLDTELYTAGEYYIWKEVLTSLNDSLQLLVRHNPGLYSRVIDACALTPDLEMLPAGDQTEIGEKGINLSGGQKQRLSMARAVYNNRALYLLDDPLSAVDSHVGKHMFDKVIGPEGLLRNKTRLLVTHGISFLPQVDEIVVMKDGRITEKGSYRQLLDRKGEFANFLVQYLTEKKEAPSNDSEAESELEDLQRDLEQTLGKAVLQRAMSQAKSATAVSDIDTEKWHGPEVSRSRLAEQEDFIDTPDAEKLPVDLVAGQKLIDAEVSETGGVKRGVYIYYVRAVGILATMIASVFYVGYQGFSVGVNIWLSEWSDDPEANTEISVRNKYLTVYGLLGLGQSITIMIATVLLSVFTLNAATLLHNTMLTRILRSPMSFFDTTPIGRILNRFSKDIDIVDNQIPMNLRMVITTT